MSADPLAGHAPGEADLNLYAYVRGALLKATDPLGLDTVPEYTGGFPARTSVLEDDTEALLEYLQGVEAVTSSAFAALALAAPLSAMRTRALNTPPPNNGFLGESIDYEIPIGTRLDRFGKETGSYMSPAGTPYEMRAPFPGTLAKPYGLYEVTGKVNADAGVVAPAFGHRGMGMQLRMRKDVAALVEAWKRVC